MKTKLAVVAMTLAWACQASPCRADIAISAGPGGGNPDENIVFQGAGVALGPGNLVTGRTNSTSWLLDFASSDQILGNGGQARIDAAVSGGTFGDVTVNNFRDPIVAAAVDMTDLLFNIDASADGQLSIFVYEDSAGSAFQLSDTFNVDENGNNFFRVTATAGQVFGRVVIASLSGDIFSSVRQVRVSGVPQEVIPEPASVAAWTLIGLTFAGGAAWRRRWTA